MNKKVDRGLRILIVANFMVVALLASFMVADWLQIIPPRGESGSPSPSASTPVELMQMGLAHIPTSNSCLLCHDEGGKVKTIPPLGHPLAGWTACLVCHTNVDLGRKAPGHDGIAQSECLNCHKEAPQGPVITQAHANLGKPCLDCHGSVAHLPTSMVGRNQDQCFLCHKPLASPPPQQPHPTNTNLTCRSCHQAANVGALPITHALYPDDTCVLCHDMDLASPSPTLVRPTVSPLPSLLPTPSP
jgi:hypothetical protein